MNADRLRTLAHRLASQLPGAGLEQPFGRDTDVYKVRGKVFLLLTERGGTTLVTLKSEPGESRALQEVYGEITPGYHMNKKHWISLRPGPGLNTDVVRHTVTDSYALVVATLPRRERPVDPTKFGLPPHA